MIRADVIADSISPAGHRLTTMEIVIPRCIQAELLTHRKFSRNSASSRAIPVRAMLKQVMEHPFIPHRWQAAQAGMQGAGSLEPVAALQADRHWLAARDHAVIYAGALLDLGIHKTMPNRLLEPFAWSTLIISATDWDGFWAQRCSPLAELHMEATANAMRAAYDASMPVKVANGEWHLPYTTGDERAEYSIEILQKLSAARCARVSYLTHDGQRDLEADLALFGKLVAADPPHWSPMEHQATPTPFGGRHLGNLTGWSQLRHELEYAA